MQPAASVGKLPPQDEATTTNEGSTSLDVVQIPQTVEKHDEKGAESYKNHDFDYVTNRIQTLMHVSSLYISNYIDYIIAISNIANFK